MAARCEVCAGQVMTYRRYALWMRPTSTCDACGARVRLRGFWGLVGAGVAIVVVGAWVLVSSLDSLQTTGSLWPIFLSLGVIAFALDYGSYRALSWQADGSPAEDRPES